MSGHTSISSTVPIAHFSEEEKKVSVIKAPHYEGIGPVDESGIPIAIRTVRELIQGANTLLSSRPALVDAVVKQRSFFEAIFSCLLVWTGFLSKELLEAVSSFWPHVQRLSHYLSVASFCVLVMKMSSNKVFALVLQGPCWLLVKERVPVCYLC